MVAFLLVMLIGVGYHALSYLPVEQVPRSSSDMMYTYGCSGIYLEEYFFSLLCFTESLTDNYVRMMLDLSLFSAYSIAVGTLSEVYFPSSYSESNLGLLIVSESRAKWLPYGTTMVLFSVRVILEVTVIYALGKSYRFPVTLLLAFAPA